MTEVTETTQEFPGGRTITFRAPARRLALIAREKAEGNWAVVRRLIFPRRKTVGGPFDGEKFIK